MRTKEPTHNWHSTRTDPTLSPAREDSATLYYADYIRNNNQVYHICN
jgi:hypothetical protein